MKMIELVAVMISMFALVILRATAASDAYHTYIVGGDVGWITPTQENSFNYTQWASNITFSLGDSLIFNYNVNDTVTQTDSEETYDSCDFDSNDDSIQYWSPPSSTTATVELSRSGDTYFLSSSYSGARCKSGQKFGITVEIGQGLPPSSSPSNGGEDGAGDGFPNFNGPKLPPSSSTTTTPSDSAAAAEYSLHIPSHFLIPFLLLLRFFF